MVHAELGDAARDRRGDDVGRVEPAAQPDLDDAGVGGRAREGEEGGGRGRLEEAELHAVGGLERFAENRGQHGVPDQLSGEADALVEADQVRARIDMGLEPRRLDRGAQEGAGRALAVGPGDVEDGRQRPLRIAEPVEQKEIRSSPNMSRPGESKASRSSWAWTCAGRRNGRGQPPANWA